jgi:hypothetical protein
MKGKAQRPLNKGGRKRIERIPAQAQTILDGVAKGMTLTQACAAAGVTRRTYARWARRFPALRKATDEANLKQKETRVAEATRVLAAQREARLEGKPQEPREWNVPSCVKGLGPTGALAPGEVRIIGNSPPFYPVLTGTRVSSANVTFHPLWGGKSF